MKINKIPFGLLGILVTFWAWTVGFWPLGIILALLLESPKYLHWRYQMQDRHLGRLFKLILLLISFLLVILLLTQLTNGIYQFVKWLPIILLPIMLIQIYSEEEVFPYHILLNSFKNNPIDAASNYTKTMDLSFIYALLVLVSTSISTNNDIAMFIYFFSVIAICVHYSHPKNATSLKLFSLTCLTLSLAIIIQSTLTYLQELTTDWLLGDWSQTDVFKSRTTLGDIGTLKLSNRILMRIKAKDRKPMFLQQASYSLYNFNNWYMQSFNFVPLEKDAKTNNWIITNVIPSDKSITISSTLKNNKGILALPVGTTEIALMRSGKLSKNLNNSIRIEEADDLLDFTAYYHDSSPSISEPVSTDLLIPSSHKILIDNFVATLGLQNLSIQDALDKLKLHFELNFRYSLIQSKQKENTTPLAHFLNVSHKGHCEFYATAGALILRALEIPTRYATGYLMTEFDANNNQYIIRQRHSHAWIQAYVNGKWIALDYTPSIWAELESENEPWFQQYIDIFDFYYDKLLRWWDSDNNTYVQLFIVFISSTFLIFYIRRLNMKKSNLKWQRLKPKFVPGHIVNTRNGSSPFYKVIQYLELHFGEREPSETLHTWLNRIDSKFILDDIPFHSLLNSHYTIIYGTKPLTESELLTFSKQIKHWLNQRISE